MKCISLRNTIRRPNHSPESAVLSNRPSGLESYIFAVVCDDECDTENFKDVVSY